MIACSSASATGLATPKVHVPHHITIAGSRASDFPAYNRQTIFPTGFWKDAVAAPDGTKASGTLTTRVRTRARAQPHARTRTPHLGAPVDSHPVRPKLRQYGCIHATAPPHTTRPHRCRPRPHMRRTERCCSSRPPSWMVRLLLPRGCAAGLEPRPHAQRRRGPRAAALGARRASTSPARIVKQSPPHRAHRVARREQRQSPSTRTPQRAAPARRRRTPPAAALVAAAFDGGSALRPAGA